MEFPSFKQAVVSAAFATLALPNLSHATFCTTSDKHQFEAVSIEEYIATGTDLDNISYTKSPAIAQANGLSVIYENLNYKVLQDFQFDCEWSGQSATYSVNNGGTQFVETSENLFAKMVTNINLGNLGKNWLWIPSDTTGIEGASPKANEFMLSNPTTDTLTHWYGFATRVVGATTSYTNQRFYDSLTVGDTFVKNWYLERAANPTAEYKLQMIKIRYAAKSGSVSSSAVSSSSEIVLSSSSSVVTSSSSSVDNSNCKEITKGNYVRESATLYTIAGADPLQPTSTSMKVLSDFSTVPLLSNGIIYNILENFSVSCNWQEVEVNYAFHKGAIGDQMVNKLDTVYTKFMESSLTTYPNHYFIRILSDSTDLENRPNYTNEISLTKDNRSSLWFAYGKSGTKVSAVQAHDSITAYEGISKLDSDSTDFEFQLIKVVYANEKASPLSSSSETPSSSSIDQSSSSDQPTIVTLVTLPMVLEFHNDNITLSQLQGDDLRVFNMRGQLIQEYQIESGRVEIRRAEFAPGRYIIKNAFHTETIQFK